MDKFQFDDTFVSNAINVIPKKMHKVLITWLIVCFIILYAKPEWSVLKNDDQHSFVRILLFSLVLSLIPFIYPYLANLASKLKM